MLEPCLISQDFSKSGSHSAWSGPDSAISHLRNFGPYHEREAISAQISQPCHIIIKQNLHHLMREDVDACQSGNASRVIPKAPGLRWTPASYISYKWRNCGTAMNLPRHGHPAKTSLSSVSIKIMQIKKEKEKEKSNKNLHFNMQRSAGVFVLGSAQRSWVRCKKEAGEKWESWQDTKTGTTAL